MTRAAISPSRPLLPRALPDESAGPDGAPLAISGWRLRQRVQPNGRAVFEINDDTGDLVGLITSTTLPMLTVDAAWRGRAERADGTHQWWALAIGHASAGDDDLTAIFTQRLGPHTNPRRVVVRPARTQGLWIAAAPGLYTSVSCRQGPQHRIRRLAPVPRLHAAHA
jgi:hypothetical protein